jgi:hypothetical protein
VRRILQRARERLQRAAHLGGERARQRRGRHALPAPLEQRVVEQRAHPAQRMADRGLRQVELARGRGDAAFAVDGVEHHEEIQVDAGELHAEDSGTECRELILANPENSFFLLPAFR